MINQRRRAAAVVVTMPMVPAKATIEIAGRERIGGFILAKAAAQMKTRTTMNPEEDPQGHARVVGTLVVQHPSVGRAVEVKAGTAADEAAQRRLLHPRLQTVQNKAKKRRAAPKGGNTTSLWRRLQWGAEHSRGQMGHTTVVVQTTDLILANIGKRFAANGAKNASETGRALLLLRDHLEVVERTLENVVVEGVEDIPAPQPDRIPHAAGAVVSDEARLVRQAGLFIGNDEPCARR